METEPVAQVLLNNLHHIAAALLSVNGKKPFDDTLAESMELIGRCVNADRVHIWRSGTMENSQVLFHSYEWDKEVLDDKMRIPLNIYIPYEELPMWETIIKHGEILHGPFSTMPPDFQEFFAKYKMKAIAIIPIFLNDQIWGLFTLDCFKTERTFSEEEIHILQSAGLMMSNAILRNETLCRINEEHQKCEELAHWYHSILDAIPLPITVTDPEMNWMFINRAVENFLGEKRKDMLGKHCSNWGANICNTDKCGIACVKRGKKQTYFTQNNLSFKVDVGMLKDKNDQTAGFIEIVQDVTVIEEMTKKQAETEAASNAKTTFLANMSHEMRTPMNAILGISEIQLQNNALPEEAAKAFGQIYESGDLLLNIINDILDLSKIEAGKLELLPVKYDIPSLINDTAQLNRLRYESSPIDFIIHVDENTPLNLYGDELRIKQVLNNIISNAFKYTGKGIIEFSVSSEQGSGKNVALIFSIRDTGQGMTEEQISRLFDEYTRFNANANRETVGTGLGMSITKRLVDLMNGTISVQSEPGIGSVFIVRLPQEQTGSQLCGPELARKLRDFRFQSMALAKKALFMREYMPYGSVLVVDDVESNIYVATGMMSPYGLMIDTASSGFEAIEKIKNGKVYDIVFMDHMMPKMDGIEAAKIMRDMGYTNIIVALTANALIGQEKIFLDNGFDGFISKPIDSRELNHVLNELLRNRKPPEVVEAARQYQRDKGMLKADSQAQAKPKLSEMQVFFLNDAKNAITVLEDLNKKIHTLDESDIELYSITVHGIKSALSNIGEKELSGFAYKLEQAGDEHNLPVVINETPVFIEALKGIIRKIR